MDAVSERTCERGLMVRVAGMQAVRRLATHYMHRYSIASCFFQMAPEVYNLRGRSTKFMSQDVPKPSGKHSSGDLGSTTGSASD